MPASPKHIFHLNPIHPCLTYECIRRIFNRESHSCLSAENKPKAVEVVLKFVKLHDGVDFQDQAQLQKLFSAIISVDFVGNRKELMQETYMCLAEAYRQTPGGFGVPSSHVLKSVVEAIDVQMDADYDGSTCSSLGE